MENWRNFLILEGGNVFSADHEVDSIPRDFIEPTLEKYYEELSRIFPEHSQIFNEFVPLGSVGKKAKSGDIDLAVNVSSLFPDKKITDESLSSWNINPEDWRNAYQKFAKRARTATQEQLELRAFLLELAKYIDKNSDLIVVNLKKITPGAMFSLFPQFDTDGNQRDVGVQMDWMLGNSKWLSFSYFSDFPSEEQPMLKGLHRTQLLLSMFQAKNYSFKHSDGVFKVEIVNGKRKIGQKITDNVSEAINILGQAYGANISIKNIQNFNTLYDWMEKNASEQDRNAVYDIYLRILDRTNGNKEKDPVTGEINRCGYIPQELEQYYKQNKERLGLKGKYLCKHHNKSLSEGKKF